MGNSTMQTHITVRIREKRILITRAHSRKYMSRKGENEQNCSDCGFPIICLAGSVHWLNDVGQSSH